MVCVVGRVVSGYLVTIDNAGQNHWTLIGKKNPMLPQMFYPLSNEVIITQGDILVRDYSVRAYILKIIKS